MYTLFDLASSFLPLYRDGQAVGPEWWKWTTKIYETLESQVASIHADAVNKQPFMQPSGPPEDELVSAVV